MSNFRGSCHQTGLFDSLVFFHAESENAAAVVGLSGAEDDRRPFGLVRRVGIVLGFEADAVALLVDDSLLALDGTVQEVPGIDLDAGLVGIDEERDAGLRAVQHGSILFDVAGGIQHPVVVVAVSVADLFVIGEDILADGLYSLEIERRAGGRNNFSRGHVRVVDRGE